MSSIHPLTDDELAKFRSWLTERGAEILSPTNEYEVIRFRARGVVQILYRNRKNRCWQSTNGADATVLMFRTGGSWSANEKRNRRRLGHLVMALLERDGDRCFYCDKPMPDCNISIEHLVPHAHRGPDHMSNLALAHRVPCNRGAGAMSVVEKVRLRDKLRAARTETELNAAQQQEAATK